jgi:hypothetical protein
MEAYQHVRMIHCAMGLVPSVDGLKLEQRLVSSCEYGDRPLGISDHELPRRTSLVAEDHRRRRHQLDAAGGWEGDIKYMQR